MRKKFIFSGQKSEIKNKPVYHFLMYQCNYCYLFCAFTTLQKSLNWKNPNIGIEFFFENYSLESHDSYKFSAKN